MGCDKLLLEVGGQPLHQHGAKALAKCCGQLLQVGRDLQLAQFMFVPDQVSNQGPLAGLSAALEACTTDWMVAVAADLPAIDWVAVSWLQETAEQAFSACRSQQSATDNLLAVVPSSTSGLEPLCAAYRSELAPLISSAFSAGERSIHAFLASLDQRVLIVDGSDKLKNAVINLNRPSDWQHFIGAPQK